MSKSFRLNPVILPLVIAFLEGLSHFGRLYGDSSGYISIVKVFRGIGSPTDAMVIHWHGILRPLVPLLAIPLSFVISVQDAIASVNLVLLLIGTWVVFVFVKDILDEELAVVSAILFATSVQVLVFSVSVLTDGAGYTFLIAGMAGILLWAERKGPRAWALVGVLVGLAMLAKETNIILLVYLLVRLISVRTQHQLRMTIVVFAVGLAIPLIWSGMIGFSYLQMYQAGLAYQGLGYKGALVSPRVFLKSLVYAFYLSLPVAFLGFIKIDNDKFKILLEMLVSALPLLLLWPTLPEGRFSFLLFPAVIPLAAIGLRDTAISLSNRPLLKELDTKQWLILLTLFIVVFNTYLTLARYGRFPWGP